MKIRLPGFKTTISINFVFILIGIALFTFGETVLIWSRRGARPVPLEHADATEAGAGTFQCSMSNGLHGSGILASHGALAMLGLTSLAAMMVLGACVYVVLNTGLVSLVISLAEGRSLGELLVSAMNGRSHTSLWARL